MFSALSEQLVEENAIMYPLDGSGRKFLNIEVRCIIENISYQRYLKNLEIFYEMNVIFLFFFFLKYSPENIPQAIQKVFLQV